MDDDDATYVTILTTALTKMRCGWQNAVSIEKQHHLHRNSRYRSRQGNDDDDDGQSDNYVSVDDTPMNESVRDECVLPQLSFRMLSLSLSLSLSVGVHHTQTQFLF